MTYIDEYSVDKGVIYEDQQYGIILVFISIRYSMGSHLLAVPGWKLIG
jgi:hypothetical protein